MLLHLQCIKFKLIFIYRFNTFLKSFSTAIQFRYFCDTSTLVCYQHRHFSTCGDLVKSVRSYFSISHAPWDFRYARMRNADLFVLGDERAGRTAIVTRRTCAPTHMQRGYKCTRRARQARLGLQVTIQCPFARGRSFPAEGRAYARTRERR